MDPAQTLASVAIALTGVLAALPIAYWVARRTTNDALQGVQLDFDQLLTATTNLASQTRDHMDRSYQHAQRASAHNSTTRRREEQAVPAMSESAYVAHLEAGGAVIPEVEQQLGLQ